ncbi:MAG TPA: hypothetical protein VMU32_03685 [Solirubrobacteraceae bacterium]|nr:hypothetical protein [Solirubrobacteraceae bacterium]
MLTPLTTVLRLASRLACLVVLASFALFVVEQTGSASSGAQNAVLGTNNGVAARPTPHRRSHESTLHKTIDEAAERLTSPFSGVTAGDTSQWVIRGVGTLLALVVYGIGVGYLTRLMRLRV